MGSDCYLDPCRGGAIQILFCRPGVGGDESSGAARCEMSSYSCHNRDMVHGLLEAIRTQSVRTGVIGLGYVGLPLLVEFAKAGFQAIGVDIDQKKVDAIEGGEWES